MHATLQLLLLQRKTISFFTIPCIIFDELIGKRRPPTSSCYPFPYSWMIYGAARTHIPSKRRGDLLQRVTGFRVPQREEDHPYDYPFRRSRSSYHLIISPSYDYSLLLHDSQKKCLAFSAAHTSGDVGNRF